VSLITLYQSNHLADRYENLEIKASSLVKDELKKEITHLRSIDYIIYELDAVKRVLNEQENIMNQFKNKISLLFPIDDESSDPYVHPNLEVFERLRAEAQRVRESVRLFNEIHAVAF
jgi:hypothetical protein